MSVYHLHRVQFLPATIEAVWDFFADPANLAKLMPPSVGLVHRTALTGEPIHPGMIINYTVRPLLGIPFRWVSEISWVQQPSTFTDKLAHGPFTLWEHTHSFTAVDGGVKVSDEVLYGMPLGFVGSFVHALLVRRHLERIFDFRARALAGIFTPCN